MADARRVGDGCCTGCTWWRHASSCRVGVLGGTANPKSRRPQHSAAPARRLLCQKKAPLLWLFGFFWFLDAFHFDLLVHLVAAGRGSCVRRMPSCVRNASAANCEALTTHKSPLTWLDLDLRITDSKEPTPAPLTSASLCSLQGMASYSSCARALRMLVRPVADWSWLLCMCMCR